MGMCVFTMCVCYDVYVCVVHIVCLCVYNVCAQCVYTMQVAGLVQGTVPGSQQVTDVGAELSFILPSSATHHFPGLFDTLESMYVHVRVSLP